MPRLSERLAALERGTEPDARQALPLVLPADAPDAELEALRRAGRDAYRANDDALHDLFV